MSDTTPETPESITDRLEDERHEEIHGTPETPTDGQDGGETQVILDLRWEIIEVRKERDTLASQLAQAQGESEKQRHEIAVLHDIRLRGREELTAAREECERLKNDYYVQGERLAVEIEHSERQKEEYGKALEHINWLYCRGYDPKPRPEWVKEALAKHQQADS